MECKACGGRGRIPGLHPIHGGEVNSIPCPECSMPQDSQDDLRKEVEAILKMVSHDEIWMGDAVNAICSVFAQERQRLVEKVVEQIKPKEGVEPGWGDKEGFDSGWNCCRQAVLEVMKELC